MERIINGVVVDMIVGDITKQSDYTAIVNAANAELMPGGGVAGAIHNAAGPKLAEECKPLSPIKPGEAVITNGFELVNKYVIHCLGPVYGIDEPADKLLANCYVNALKIADEKQIPSVAFPAISTGAFGYPIEEAGKITISVIIEMIESLRYVKFIRLVLFTEEDYKVFAEVLDFYHNKYLFGKS